MSLSVLNEVLPPSSRLGRGIVAGGALAVLLASNVIVARLSPHTDLIVRFGAHSSIKTAVAYVDSGIQVWPIIRGELVAAQSSGGDPISIRFRLPHYSFDRVELDLPVGSGGADIGDAVISVAGTTRALQIPLRDLRAFAWSTSVETTSRGIHVSTTDRLGYAKTIVQFPQRIFPTYTTGEVIIHLAVLNAILVTAGLLFWFRRRVGRKQMLLFGGAVKTVHQRFTSWARRITCPGVLEIDAAALWFLTACVILFGGLAIAGLHGSSCAIWTSYAYCDSPHQPLLGAARVIRSDEWNIHTPAMAYEYFRMDRLSPADASVGPGETALFANLPCRHILQVFRPEFWPFHLLSFDAAFAFYWQIQGLLLVIGVFALLLLLTQSTALAAVGSAWFYLSAFTQWGFSWPSLLPDMVGLFGIVMTSGCYVLVARRTFPMLLAAFVCAVSAVDFALCFYPPHQISFVLSGAILLAWWVATRRRAIFTMRLAVFRTLAIGGCVTLISVALLIFYIDARGAIAAAAATVYPGRRSCDGGGMPLALLISHFLDFAKHEDHVPLGINICENSGYLWLAPATLLFTKWHSLQPRRRSLLPCLWVAFALIAGWMLLPIPATIGRWVLLDKVPPFRCLPALGLLNIAIVMVFLSSRAPTNGKVGKARTLGIVCVTAIVFVLANASLNSFFSSLQLGVATIVTTLLLVCLSMQRVRAFGIVLFALLAQNALINPLDRGIPAIENSSVFKYIQSHPELKRGSWVVYSAGTELPAFLSAAGADVLNSLKFVPDLSRMQLFDPERKYEQILNQSCYIKVLPASQEAKSTFESPFPGMIIWKLSPSDPALRAAGVSYVAFDQALPVSNSDHLTLVANFPGVTFFKVQ